MGFKQRRDTGGAAALRAGLVAEIERAGDLRSAVVKRAMTEVARELFVPEQPLARVYEDASIPTKRVDGAIVSSLSQPSAVAIMLEDLQLRPGQRVLEIGAGTGYNAALIAHIVGPRGQVVTLDIDDDLVRGARAHLASAGFPDVRVLCRDAARGAPGHARFDRIIATVGLWDIAPAWWDQLAPTGRLVTSVWFRGIDLLAAFERDGDRLVSAGVRPFGFVRMRGSMRGPEPRVALGDAGVLMMTDAGESSAARVESLLRGPGRERDTGVRTRADESHSLYMWLAMSSPRFGVLLCRRDAVGAVQRLIPPGPQRISTAAAMLAATGVAAQFQRGDELRVYGWGEPAAADELIAAIRAWDAAGRPGSDRYRLEAMRRDPARADPPASAGAVATARFTRPATVFTLHGPRPALSSRRRSPRR